MLTSRSFSFCPAECGSFRGWKSGGRRMYRVVSLWRKNYCHVYKIHKIPLQKANWDALAVTLLHYTSTIDLSQNWHSDINNSSWNLVEGNSLRALFISYSQQLEDVGWKGRRRGQQVRRGLVAVLVGDVRHFCESAGGERKSVERCQLVCIVNYYVNSNLTFMGLK